MSHLITFYDLPLLDVPHVCLIITPWISDYQHMGLFYGWTMYWDRKVWFYVRIHYIRAPPKYPHRIYHLWRLDYIHVKVQIYHKSGYYRYIHKYLLDIYWYEPVLSMYIPLATMVLSSHKKITGLRCIYQGVHNPIE